MLPNHSENTSENPVPGGKITFYIYGRNNIISRLIMLISMLIKEICRLNTDTAELNTPPYTHYPRVPCVGSSSQHLVV